MKTLKPTRLLFLFIFSLGLLSSCDKNDDNSSEEQSDTFIRFNIDNTNYDFKDIITASGSDVSFTLNGNNGEGVSNPGDTQISIFLPKGTSTGTYDIDGAFGGDYKISFSSDALGFDFDFADSGSITITSVTEDFIEGTFNASVTSSTNTTINITDGKFKGFTID